jgi:hypothetical protein
VSFSLKTWNPDSFGLNDLSDSRKKFEAGDYAWQGRFLSSHVHLSRMLAVPILVAGARSVLTVGTEGA